MGNHLNNLGILLQPRVARAISSVLVLVFASACLIIANDLKKTFWDKQIDFPSSSTETNIQKPAATKTLSARNINQWHLFGQAQKKKATTAPAPITAPETRLNLKLNGIIASDGKNTAGAIIEKNPGKQEYFSINDTISNGVTLKEVYKDRVILSRNGRLETLSLPKTSIRTSHNNLKTAPIKRTPTAPTSLSKPSVSRDAKDTKKLLEKYREMIQQRQQRLNKK
jgi:general secretion pathway protein C